MCKSFRGVATFPFAAQEKIDLFWKIDLLCQKSLILGKKEQPPNTENKI